MLPVCLNVLMDHMFLRLSRFSHLQGSARLSDLLDLLVDK